LRANRETAGLTLKQAAARIGTSVVYLSEVERGLRGPLAANRTKKLGDGFDIDDLLRLAALVRGHGDALKEQRRAGWNEAIEALRAREGGADAADEFWSRAFWKDAALYLERIGKELGYV
jgi:transcriptional regulator with XRE-family HTH domain